jgi:hypothetical protein
MIWRILISLALFHLTVLDPAQAQSETFSFDFMQADKLCILSLRQRGVRIAAGMRGAELQELLGVDEKGLAAVRKRLKRMLQETCPSEMAS